MNPLALSAFITSGVSLMLGGLVFFRKRKDDITISYTLLTVSFFVWIFGIGMEVEAPNKDWGLFWNRWLYSGAIFVPTFFVHFVQAYLGKIKRTQLISYYVVSIILFIFNFTPFFVKDVIPKGSFNYASIPGIIYPFYVLYFSLIFLYCTYLIIKEFKKSIGIRRAQLKFIIFAYVIGFLGASTNFLLVFDILDAPPVGNYFIGLYLLILFYAIVKHRLMDINIVFTKGTTYVLLLLLLFVPLLLIGILSQKVFFGKISYLHSFIVFSLLFLAALLFGRIKPRTEKAVEQIFFKNRYDYRETLRTFSKALVSILDLQSLSKTIVETITQTMGVEKASLFLVSEEKGGYSLRESKNVNIATSTQHLSRDGPLPFYLQKVERLLSGRNWPRESISQ